MSEPVLGVLAAGASERLGEPKALASIGARSVLERLLAAGALFDERVVVTGAHDAEIRAALAAVPALAAVAVVTNAGWARGRTGSVAALQAARPDRDLVLAPVDVPLVPRAVFAALAEAWSQAGAPPHGFLAPRFEPDDPAAQGAPERARVGRHGHPIVLGRELARAAAALPPDRPLRVLRDQAEPLFAVPVRNRAVLDDLDTAADLADLRRRVAGLDREAQRSAEPGPDRGKTTS